MIAVWFAQNKGTHIKKRQKTISDIRNLSFHLNSCITQFENLVKKNTKIFKNNSSMFLLGKGDNEAIAKEGALKIKEVAYIHAEGYSSSALKHGPFALIIENLPIIIIDTNKKYREKSINAFNETTARKAAVLVITNDNESYLNAGLSKENIINIPYNDSFGSLLANIYIQLLSYQLSIEFGYNPDFPRNLAKVVTVE
jgi:glucosamine--fructose-6-phosphate aminotransferase (isomerizing)